MKKWTRRWLACIGAAAALFLACAPSPKGVAAAPKPVVAWSAEVLAMDDRNPFLDMPGVRERIARAITAKLHALDMEGKLPFALQETDTDYGLHAITGDEPIGLVPLSTLDTSFDSKYFVNGKTYYRSIVYSGLSIAVCSADSASNSWRILGTIPLNGYDVIGDNAHFLRETPISRQEKADKFVQVSVKMIQQYLDFGKDRKMWRDMEMKSLMPDTYQVTEVSITSPKAQAMFAGREEEIKDVIAAAFTSSYQRRTRRIVYPPRGGGRWKQDVARNLYTYRMNTPSGEITFSMEQPKHPIRLELFGIASQEMESNQKSEVVRDIFYKAWLRKKPVEGREKPEWTAHTIRREVKTDNAWLEYDAGDVFTELVMDAAEQMGAQKQ